MKLLNYSYGYKKIGHCLDFKLLTGLILLSASCAFGQWTSQTISLSPGWNAIYIELQPANDEAESVFSGLPIDSVWGYNGGSKSIQFIHDASSLTVQQPEWLVFFPKNHSNIALRNLLTISGNHAYLVNVLGNQAVQLKVIGKPIVNSCNWIPDSYNLVGFQVPDAGGPSFQSFFASSPSQSGQPIWKLNSQGLWIRITDPAQEYITRGKAYWIRSSGASDFVSPVAISLDSGKEIAYGKYLTECNMTLKNISSDSAHTVNLRNVSSAEAPSGLNYPIVAGEVALSYFNYSSDNSFGFIPFTNSLSITEPGHAT